MTHYQLSVFVVASVFAITSVAEENIYCNRYIGNFFKLIAVISIIVYYFE